MSELYKQFLDAMKIVFLAAILVVGVNYVFAEWSGPSASPPNGNPGAPVNVGSELQVKSGPLGVRAFNADNTAISGTLNVSGRGAFTADLDVLNGTVSARDVTAAGALTGGSLNVGAGAVTGGQGTFSGGVIANDGDVNTAVYLQTDLSDSSGATPTVGCSAQSDRGRLIIDHDNGNFYVCTGVSGGTPRWRKITLEI